MPGTARMGPIETNGFDGQRTMASAVSRAAGDLGRRARRLDPGEGHLEHVGRLVEPDEVLLEREPAIGRPDPRADGLVGHREDRRRDAERALDVAIDRGEAIARPQAPRPVDVDGEVAVAEAEPGRLAEALQHPGCRPRLAGQAPAALAVGQAGEGVEHGVVVGADEEAVELLVVGGVDDDRELARRQDGSQPMGELRPAHAARQRHDAGHAVPQPASAARTSPIRAMVSASYGAGRRTTIVRKPRST